MFSARQLDNFYWAFQIQFIGVYLFASLAIFNQSHYRSRLALAILFATLSTFTMANGLLIWPLMLVITILARGSLKTIAVTLIVGGINALLFFWKYTPLPAKFTSSDQLYSALPDIFSFFLVYLGMPAAGIGEMPAKVAGVTALFLFLWITYRAFTRRERIDLFSFGLIAFIILSALSTSVGRSSSDPMVAVVSRYATPVLIMWGVLLARLACVEISRNSKYISQLVISITLLSFMVDHHTQYEIWSGQLSRVRQAQLSLALGVHDSNSMIELNPFMDVALPQLNYLKAHQLSIFSERNPVNRKMLKNFRLEFPNVKVINCSATARIISSLPGGGIRGDFEISGSSPFGKDSTFFFIDPNYIIRGQGYMSYDVSDQGVTHWSGFTQKLMGPVRPVWISASHTEACFFKRRISADFIPAQFLNEVDFERWVEFDLRHRGTWSRDEKPFPYYEPRYSFSNYSSLAGNDAHTGDISFKNVPVPTTGSLYIPFVTGPSAKDISIKVADSQDKLVLIKTRKMAGSPRFWRALEINSKNLAKSRTVDISFRDKGKGFGQWVIVGPPFWGSTKGYSPVQ